MAKSSKLKANQNNGIQLHTTFFVVWFASLVTILIAHLLTPDDIVLGTASLSPTTALLLSSGTIAWITNLTLPLFIAYQTKKKIELSVEHWLIGYLVVNLVAVYFVTRFSHVFGLGIASWMHVIGLAIGLDLLQGLSVMAFGEATKKVYAQIVKK